jgi:hypothetical protein
MVPAENGLVLVGRPDRPIRSRGDWLNGKRFALLIPLAKNKKHG